MILSLYGRMADAVPIVTEWACTKLNPVAAMIVEELFKRGKPSLG